MRYVLYLFTLMLVFVGGMLVAHEYLPERNTSIAAAISVPDPQQKIPQLKDISLDKANRNLEVLGQALNSCPVIVAEEKDRLLAEVNLLLARQDFDMKKALFELEIAKNTPGSSVTAQFAKASADYAAALEQLEALALKLYPPQPKEEPANEEQTAPTKPAQQEASTQAPKKAEPTAKEQASNQETPAPAEPKQATPAKKEPAASTQESAAPAPKEEAPLEGKEASAKPANSAKEPAPAQAEQPAKEK